VGSYPIVPAPSGANLGNYNVVIVDGALTVTPAALTATANNATRVYGAANPALSGTVTGAVNGDAFTETFTTMAATSSNVGSYPIVPAVAGPQSGNYAVTLVNGALTVTGASTSTTLSAPASAAYGASVALTATVSSGAGTPGGTVTFSSGSTTLGTGALNAAGAATLNTTALPGGTNTVTAVYAAAGNFAASTSAAVTVSVSASPSASYSMSASPASLTVQQGAAASTMITFTPTGGYKDTVSLSCSNLPANVSCAFAKNQISLAGNNQSVNVGLTLQTTAQSAAKQPPPVAALPTALLALAFWWPGSVTGIAVFLRRRKLVRKRVSWQTCLLMLCTLAFAAGLSACGGGGSSSPSQPASSSPVNAQVTVVATGTTTATPQTLVVTLTITQ
jgi:hypothetical protein